MYPVAMADSPQHARFRQVYEASYARILGYALRRSSSPEDAADAVAETFAIAWRKLAEMPNGDEAILWLYAVARRVLANQRRKQTRQTELIDLLAREYEEAVSLDPQPGIGPSTALIESWRALRPADRDLLGLLVWETLTGAQIAKVIDCPRTVVKVRLHRARRRFARELERRGVDPLGMDSATGADGSGVKPSTLVRHVQAGRAEALSGTEAT
jgi:RNA polymerase sigma-70 factor, ECF subfamily